MYDYFCDKIGSESLERLRVRDPDHAYSKAPSLLTRQLRLLAFDSLRANQIQRLSHEFLVTRVPGKIEGLNSEEDIRQLCRFGILHRVLDDPLAPGAVEFAHLSFQEFLAAKQLAIAISNGLTLGTFIKRCSISASSLRQVLTYYSFSDTSIPDRPFIATLWWQEYKASLDVERLYSLAALLARISPRPEALAAIYQGVKQCLARLIDRSPVEVVEDKSDFQWG